MINSQSLHKSNVVLVFKDRGLQPPENSEMTALYESDKGRGAQLVDDPLMRMKIMDVPQLKLQVAWEAERLRLEDMGALEPDESLLMDELVRVYEKLCEKRPIEIASFGFNFDVFYQTSDVIRIGDLWNEVSKMPLTLGDSLLDFGWQWTIAEKSGRRLDAYFTKVTAPLEFVMHHNAHFNVHPLPALKELKDLFKRSYERTRTAAENLKL